MPDWKCWKTWLVIVMAVAFSLRIGAAVALQTRLDRQPDRTFLIEGDANGYWLLATQLAADKPFELYDPPRRVMRMPGFPWLLSLSQRAFGDDMFSARLCLAVLGGLACFCVFWLGRELTDPQTAVVATGWAAVCPAFVGLSPVILSETVFSAMLVLSLIPMAKLVQTRDSTRTVFWTCCWAVSAGLLVGIATLIRPSWLPAALLFAALYWGFVERNRRGLFAAGLVLLGVLIPLLPWIWRNYQVTGHVVATTLWAGPSLYDGLNPQADGSSEMSFVERDGVYRSESEFDADRHYRRAAWEFVMSHPGRVVQLAGLKLARFWSPWPNAAEFRDWKLSVPLTLFFLLTIGLAAYGGWQSRHRGWLCALTVGPLVYFTCLHTIFVGSIRYRLPAEYPLTILVAIGIRQLLQRRNDPAPSSVNATLPASS